MSRTGTPDLFDHYRVFDAGDHFHNTAAGAASLDVKATDDMIIFGYTDDIVLGFESKSDANRHRAELKSRLSISHCNYTRQRRN